MSLRSPSRFFAGNEDLGRAGKRQTILKPCQWVAINSKWWWAERGVRSQACGWTRAVGTQVTLLLATFTLQSWPQSDTPKFPTSLPLGHFSYTDYHILDLPHSITGPLPHLPIRPPSPPSHSCSQHSEASVHSVYIALGPEGPNRDWVFTSSLPPRCQRASWVFFLFEQGV